MAKTIQIRNVPEVVHGTLKSRAAEAGVSLSEYVLAELRDLAALPTQKETFERLAARPVRKTGISAASAVRRVRGS